MVPWASAFGWQPVDYASRYAQKRVQFNQEIVKFQLPMPVVIAEVYTELEAARLLLMQAAFSGGKRPFVGRRKTWPWQNCSPPRQPTGQFLLGPPGMMGG